MIGILTQQAGTRFTPLKLFARGKSSGRYIKMAERL